ncbi:hypothetical protein B1H26_21810 [Amycolatopsis sp. BJA-103]|nr:hypothetical protein BKN51_12740 [Amycolatopsis sp. BJA-103]PNE17557.1 hypothetical protein B1H26_21810 [Amycolatopsis sp. BJA-103]
MVARGLLAELILSGAVSVRGGRVDILDSVTVEELAAPCGRAVLTILSRDLTVDDILAEIESPAHRVAWTALQRKRAARKSLFRGWKLTDPEFTFFWSRMLASAHQNRDTVDDRPAALWTILDQAGLHRDQLHSPGLQPRSACPDSLSGLLQRGDPPHR